jgi:hypothetical protein
MVASIGNGTCPVSSVFCGGWTADVVLGVLVAGESVGALLGAGSVHPARATTRTPATIDTRALVTA